MQDPDIRATLEACFRKCFRAPDYVLKPENTAREVPNWDSLNYIRLILEIQKAFGIRIGAVEAGQFRTAGDILDKVTLLVRQKGGPVA